MKVTIYCTSGVLEKGFDENESYNIDDMYNRYYGDYSSEEWIPYGTLDDTNGSIELI